VTLSVVTAPLELRGVPVTPFTLLGFGSALVAAAVLGWAAYHFDEAARLAWAVYPFAGVALLVVIDVLSRDASVTGQIYFLFPAIYGGALIPRRGAIAILVVSLAGELVVLAVLASWRIGVVDFVNVSAVLTTVVTVLVRSAERQADLTEELRRLAAVDSLTGLVTRRVLDEAATAALTGSRSDDGTSLLLVDVDHFKAINDTYGHPAGDAVLVQLARLVLDQSRTSDVVGRLGGDELALLMPGCPLDRAERRAQRLMETIRAARLTVHGIGVVPVSVSMGLAHVPTNAYDLRSLYAAADAALYAAKRAGRDRLVLGRSGPEMSPDPAGPETAAG
jgi:diguanylate cyclase (GGDEF)-like protein